MYFWFYVFERIFSNTVTLERYMEEAWSVYSIALLQAVSGRRNSLFWYCDDNYTACGKERLRIYV